MKRWTVVCALMCLLLGTLTLVSAQSSIGDAPALLQAGGPGGGDNSDRPSGGGSNNNNDRDDDSRDEVAAPERIPGDFDGDGTPDEQDQCVTDSGPDWNNGCPTDLSAPPVTESPDPTAPSAPQDFALPQMPPDGDCMVTPGSAQAVNVRELPLPGAQVIASLTPGQTYQVIQTLKNEFGTWYRMLIPPGWVSGVAVIQGGDCSGVPTMNSGAIDIAVEEEPECPPNARCVMPFNVVIGDAPPPPEPPDVDFVCLENGVCIGTLTTPLPDPVCTTMSICCASPGLCKSLLIWTLPEPDDPGGIPTAQVISVYIPVDPDPLPEPEPFFLAGIGGDPTAQTREHILLARQVKMSTECVSLLLSGACNNAVVSVCAKDVCFCIKPG